MAEEYYICEGIVDSKDDHRGQNALENGSEDIEDISEKPYDEEGQGEAICRTTAELRVTSALCQHKLQATKVDNAH